MPEDKSKWPGREVTDDEAFAAQSWDGLLAHMVNTIAHDEARARNADCELNVVTSKPYACSHCGTIDRRTVMIDSSQRWGICPHGMICPTCESRIKGDHQDTQD